MNIKELYLQLVQQLFLCEFLSLTLPPVLSASLPMSARQQSVPSKVITDIMTLVDQEKEYRQ